MNAATVCHARVGVARRMASPTVLQQIQRRRREAGRSCRRRRSLRAMARAPSGRDDRPTSAQSAASTGDGPLDWAAALVESQPLVRNGLAFPVAFVSASNWLAQCIYVAAKLRIPDALARGPKSVAQLAEELDADTDGLGRLMRSLSGQGPFPGLFVEVFDSPLQAFVPPPPPVLPGLPTFPFPDLRALLPPAPAERDRRYALTPLGAMLREEGTGSMRPWALFSGEELGKAWTGLLPAVKNGVPAFGESQGLPESDVSFWDYMARYPDAGATFDASMQALSVYTEGSGAEGYDWTRRGLTRSVVDVGGGTGLLLAGILRAHPELHGTIFDQASVLEGAPEVLSSAGVADRCDLEAGSFFEPDAIPSGKDVYIMKHILHDWNDTDSVRILSKVAAAMRPTSRLVLLELVKSARAGYEPWNLDFADYFDLNMLVTVGGKERTEAEWTVLLAASGFELVSITPPTQLGAVSAIEVQLVGV